MALKTGTRGKIVEILERTPDIPEACQWCMFLRNHDELTLEMVTEEKRRYMWEQYAPEPRMRLNLGIRRRLAPLVDNDRRRIELLNAILFSMPGSPIIYYGDEIGMGDNIWLDDRNGVRTPMQWNDGPNAGFSSASSDALYAPVIDDEVFGYQRINVAAQQADPNSLLNWTKHLVRVRQAHPTFGRGGFRFLLPENEHVLAYLRIYDRQTVLAVANLADSSQAAALGLGEYAGATPVDLLTNEHLRSITPEPYTLNLPPYGYRWLELQ
jgi:maltose alpha-D-glucosyltransferase/alpha-amylase